MEPGTGLTILGGAIGSAKLLEKILGPTAEYIGEGIKEWTQRRVHNVSRIFEKAKDKLGARLDEPGGVSPRVLKGILDEGSFLEDELSSEYFAGVLASSKSERTRDDRGATQIKLISNLSSYQIRTHFIFYTSLWEALRPFNSVVNPGTDRAIMLIYIQTPEYYIAMDLDSEFKNEDEKLNILAHSMNGLKRSELIDNYTYGNKEAIIKSHQKFPNFMVCEDELSEHGITFQPTPGGIELYLWAHGLGHITHFRFLDPEIEFKTSGDIKLPERKTILYSALVEHRMSISQNGQT
ncbi:hypothetical protein KA005_76700 [bacterium]|nr:hypothetical protein [bacterium]